MISNILFLVATMLLSLNFIRPYGLAISDWFYLFSLCIAFAEIYFVERKNIACWLKNLFLAPAVLILLGAIISSTSALQVDVAVMEIIQQIYAVTIFVSLTWLMVQRGNTDWVVKAFILSGLFSAMIALIDNFTGSRIGAQLSGTPNLELWYRFAGTLGHPNKFGYFLVLTSILTLSYLGKPNEKFLSKFLIVAATAVQLFAIYLSGSVTAYLGIAVGVLVLFLFSEPFRKIFLKFAMPTISVGTIAFIFVLILGLKTPFGSGLSSENIISLSLSRVETLTADSRLVVYQQAIAQIAHSPIIGVGYDQVSTSGIALENRYLLTSVHNVLLQVFYAGGIFAFIGWLLIYIIIGTTITRVFIMNQSNSDPLIIGIAASAASLLIMDQFQDAIYQREKWLIIGLLAGITWTRSNVEVILPSRRMLFKPIVLKWAAKRIRFK